MDSQKVVLRRSLSPGQAGGIVLGRDISVGGGRRWRRADRHKGTLAQTQAENLGTANAILPSLCNVPTASSHQYVGLLITSLGISTPGLMPTNHTRSYLLKEKFIVKCQASGDLPWAHWWAF